MQYITMWAYPWDLIAEGPDTALAYLKNEVGLTAISVATAYHSLQAVLPHNPRWPVFIAPAAVYFQPLRELYEPTPIAPPVSPLLGQENWLAQIAEACQRQGLGLVAWTVCLHSSTLATRYPEYAVRDLFGTPSPAYLCPSWPAVRDYLVALCTDLDNYGLQALELEGAHYFDFEHHVHAKIGLRLGPIDRLLLSLCFCEACQDRARFNGIAVEALGDRLRQRLRQVFAAGASPEPPGDPDAQIEAFLQQVPDLIPFLGTRTDAVTALIEAIRAAIRSPLHVLLMGPSWLSGADPERLAPSVDRFEVCAYTADPAAVRRAVQQALAMLPGPDRLVVGLEAAHPSVPSEAALLAVAAAVRDLQVAGVSFYNYGLIPPAHLPWVQRAVQRLRASA